MGQGPKSLGHVTLVKQDGTSCVSFDLVLHLVAALALLSPWIFVLQCPK